MFASLVKEKCDLDGRAAYTRQIEDNFIIGRGHTHIREMLIE